MSKLILGSVFASLVVAISTPAQAATKTINHNGIECAAPTASGNWIPSTPGLYGFESGFIVCPVTQAVSENYSSTNLSYAFIYGINLTNPRLCRRSSSGSVACGTSYSVTSDTWILYPPSLGNPYDVAFVTTNTTGVSLTREYAVVWSWY